MSEFHGYKKLFFKHLKTYILYAREFEELLTSDRELDKLRFGKLVNIMKDKMTLMDDDLEYIFEEVINVNWYNLYIEDKLDLYEYDEDVEDRNIMMKDEKAK